MAKTYNILTVTAHGTLHPGIDFMHPLDKVQYCTRFINCFPQTFPYCFWAVDIRTDCMFQLLFINTMVFQFPRVINIMRKCKIIGLYSGLSHQDACKSNNLLLFLHQNAKPAYRVLSLGCQRNPQMYAS